MQVARYSVGVLLNIDKPLKRATLHNEFCVFVPKPPGTKLKPEGRMGPDGGWFHGDSEADAVMLVRQQLPDGKFARCPRC
jgi:hypothetical protein